MTLKDEVIAIEASLKDAGADLDKVLSAAKVDRSTWTRWKNGSVKGARYDTVARVREAVATATHPDAAALRRTTTEAGAAAA